MTAVSPRPVVALDEAREIATPAAVMRTYAAPSGPSDASVAVWRVDMAPDAAGPVHVVSEDQVVVVLRGLLSAVLDGVELRLGSDESLVLPAGASRQLQAGPEGAAFLASSIPGAVAAAGAGDAVPVPWAR